MKKYTILNMLFVFLIAGCSFPSIFNRNAECKKDEELILIADSFISDQGSDPKKFNATVYRDVVFPVDEKIYKDLSSDHEMKNILTKSSLSLVYYQRIHNSQGVFSEDSLAVFIDNNTSKGIICFVGYKIKDILNKP